MDSIHPSWSPLFTSHDLSWVDVLYTTGEIVYPQRKDVFRVFSMPVTDIKLVLIGQDPYHGPGQAHGLSFSVPHTVGVPPSLRNIFKELKLEFEERNYDFKHGNLEKWHQTGIFLLNAALTVLDGAAGSHMSKWQQFTDNVIDFIVKNNPTCIFLLLGAFAQKKADIIDNPKRWVFGTHPSPLSASRGFFGSNIFQRVEQKLGTFIDWQN